MAAHRQNSAGKLFFTADFKAQIHAAIDSMLEVHDDKISRAVTAAEDHKLKVNMVLNLDCSESSPKASVDLRFTPETVTDSRTILVTNEDQGEFTLMTPAQMEAKAKADRLAKTKAAAEARASGEDPGEPEPHEEPGEPAEQVEKKGRKKR